MWVDNSQVEEVLDDAAQVSSISPETIKPSILVEDANEPVQDTVVIRTVSPQQQGNIETIQEHNTAIDE